MLGSAWDSLTSSPLWLYFWQSVISNGVPAALTIVVIAFAALQFRGDRDKDPDEDAVNSSSNLAYLYDDLYGDMEQDPLQKNKNKSFFGELKNRNKNKPQLPINTGVPKLQYFKITNWNQKYDSFQYSLTAASQSKAVAAAQYRQQALQRVMGHVTVSPFQFQQLQKLEQNFLKEVQGLQAEQIQLHTALTKSVVDRELERMGMESVYQLDPAVNETESTSMVNTTSSSSSSKSSEGLSSERKRKLQELASLQLTMNVLELHFVKDVIQTVGPEHAATVRSALLGSSGDLGLLNGGGRGERPLALLFRGAQDQQQQQQPNGQRLWMTRFPGDATASQVADLRETVTAILRSSRDGDECLLVLQTGGGTVTGYGLAAAQLLRLKQAKLKLTVAVEQVAASVRM